MELEIGAQVPTGVRGDDRVVAGALPAGRYGQVIWTGHYRYLMDVNAVLIGWAKEKRIKWDAQMTSKGEAFACRLEIYETDPVEEPDPDKWVTELVIRIAD